MRFTSAMQLKDWIKNMAKRTGTPANVLLKTYFMERLLERIAVSSYRDNMILKGGFLIASMIGIDKRNTMDMDATAIRLPLSFDIIKEIMTEIISLDVYDDVSFEIIKISSIRDTGDHDDFRLLLKAKFYTINDFLKFDITVGDTIIPQEIEYPYKLLFEDRTIPIMAYNLYTILAEKIEAILSRNISNSRARDFYDVYLLLSLYHDTISRSELLDALRSKAAERGSLEFIENYAKHLSDISISPEINMVWDGYVRAFSYATGIELVDVLSLIRWIFED